VARQRPAVDTPLQSDFFLNGATRFWMRRRLRAAFAQRVLAAFVCLIVGILLLEFWWTSVKRIILRFDTLYGRVQRDLAARLAIADLRRFDNFFALAFPPFNPPSLPSATAAGFLPLSGCSAGRSPDMASIRFDAI
jgi:hypothetical protein